MKRKRLRTSTSKRTNRGPLILGAASTVSLKITCHVGPSERLSEDFVLRSEESIGLALRRATNHIHD